jgi:hypothetical protein
METEGQRPVRWLIVAALLVGGAVWYSWTAHRGPDRRQAEAFHPPAMEQPAVTRAAAEVAPEEPSDAPAPSE